MSVRLSCTDWYPGGWTLDDAIELSARLKELGVDVIDCSSGGSTPLAKIPAGASFQVPFADAIRRAAHFVLSRPGLFLNTAGDVDLLPSVLDAADRFETRPGDAEMASMLERAKTEPLFV